MVRKIVAEVSDDLLREDLEKYRKMAIELGATDAKVITADMIVIDERVRAKCYFPLCSSYGTNANCPPYAMDLDLIRKVVNKFQYAVFTKIEVPSEVLAGPAVPIERLSAPSQRKNYELVSAIESEAFYDGYYLAMAFAGGPCKIAFCPDMECTALIPGQSCRHALKVRAAMEGIGMDAYLMAAKVGWDVYPIGAGIEPTEIPHGVRLGLTLIY